MIPAAQASAPPSSQVARTTAATSMPLIRASAGFSLTARMARPIWVRLIRRWTTTSRIAVRPNTASWSGVTRMPSPSGRAICRSRAEIGAAPR